MISPPIPDPCTCGPRDIERRLHEEECPVYRIDWDNYFLDGAEWVATRADCTRRQVGCVLVRDHRVISTGYNGAPAGQRGCKAGWCPRGRLTTEEMPGYADGNHDYSNCVAIHAEMNALLYSSLEDRKDAIAYVTCEPCNECMKHLRASGVKSVFWRREDGEKEYRPLR